MIRRLWSIVWTIILGLTSIGDANPLIIFGDKQIVLFRVTKNHFLRKPIYLRCETNAGDTYKGKPIEFFWTKDGEALEWKSNPFIIKSKQGSIIIRNPKDDDEGAYRCFAKSDAGTASSQITQVKKTYLNYTKSSVVKHRPVEGMPYSLNCNISSSYPKPLIVWKLQNILDDRPTTYITDPRMCESDDGTLWFSNVTREDVSRTYKYVCEALSPAVDDTVAIAEHYIEDLQINNKSEYYGKMIPQFLSTNVTVKTRETTMLYCVYGGTPLPTIRWFKDGELIDKAESRIGSTDRSAIGRRLFILNTTLGDEGTYICEANNGIEDSRNHSVYLKVTSIPLFNRKPPQELITVTGKNVTLSCIMTGMPLPKITWSFDAGFLTESDKFIIDTYNSSLHLISEANLTIINVQINDTGFYGCTGNNDLGTNYAETMLQVID